MDLEQIAQSADITRLNLDGREILLVGTAHVSQASVDIVIQAIQDENPDTVCVELDEQRHKALRNPRHWESLNLTQVLRMGQAPFLLANLVLSAFQKRMGLQTGQLEMALLNNTLSPARLSRFGVLTWELLLYPISCALHWSANTNITFGFGRALQAVNANITNTITLAGEVIVLYISTTMI